MRVYYDTSYLLPLSRLYISEIFFGTWKLRHWEFFVAFSHAPTQRIHSDAVIADYRRNDQNGRKRPYIPPSPTFLAAAAVAREIPGEFPAKSPAGLSRRRSIFTRWGFRGKRVSRAIARRLDFSHSIGKWRVSGARPR